MMTEAQESEHRMNETKERVDLFMQALDIDEMMAHLLIQEGFSKVEDIAYISLAELAGIEGFDEALAEELQNRAKAYLIVRQDNLEKEIAALKIKDDLRHFDGLSLDKLVKLGNKGIKTLDDLADLAGDELVEVLGNEMISLDEANTLIMKAREHWFANEK